MEGTVIIHSFLISLFFYVFEVFSLINSRRTLFFMKLVRPLYQTIRLIINNLKGTFFVSGFNIKPEVVIFFGLNQYGMHLRV